MVTLYSLTLICEYLTTGNGDERRSGEKRESTIALPWSATTSAFTSSNSEAGGHTSGHRTELATQLSSLVIATKRNCLLVIKPQSTMISKLGEFNRKRKRDRYAERRRYVCEIGLPSGN